ncbi:MAG TPA: penicillin-binding protein 1C, partial [Alphaproteobacteria bacterium]|nr:penicillin-binding protein 1C [Alphaproteobacteria bacterium]
MRIPVWVTAIHAAILAMAAGLFVLDRALPPDMGRGTEMSVVVTDSGGRALRVFPVEDGRWRLAADIDRIDPAFIDALIAIEDQRFYEHAGVDPLAVMRAALTSARAGRIVSGASTLTMQTARLLEPRPRTLGSKIVESWRALQLERRLSKDEILELYLSLAPYGGNLEGIRAASWAYFGREPERLTAEQIALLVALPQSPEVRRPDLRPANARTARAAILDRLAASSLLTPARAGEAAGEDLPSRADFPAAAWHAADEARRRAPGVTDIVTSLDGGLQAELESLARAEAELAGHDVQIAILVVETRTRAVRAAVGSAGRDRQGGWIDLTDRARSPGSTLKPFIYALAFDDGFATSGTRMADIPRAFSAYQPENFDRSFRGDVTVAEALQHSLNVPAVLALDAVGARRFAASLDFAGAHGRITASGDDDAGLAIALGGVGLTVREVATLYAALGDGGSARPLSWLDDQSDIDAATPAQPLMTRETADEIVSILRRAPHPGGRMPAELSRGAPRIAFKTGTSWGFRDAWAAG